jgi:hypothetical protein
MNPYNDSTREKSVLFDESPKNYTVHFKRIRAIKKFSSVQGKSMLGYDGDLYNFEGKHDLKLIFANVELVEYFNELITNVSLPN